MARLISAREVEAAAAGGQRQIYFEPGAVLTPAARARAAELGVTVLDQPPAQSAPASVITPMSVAAPPAVSAGPSTTPAIQDHESPTYFRDPMFDALINITLELGAQVWVLKDRLDVVERIFDEHGIVSRDMIERYKRSEVDDKDWKEKRNAFVEQLYGSLSRLGG